MSNIKEEILAEFDKVFSIKDNVWGKAKYGGGNTIYQPSKVKQFISSALDKQHKADMEEVKKIVEGIDDNGGGSGRRLKIQLLNKLKDV